MAAMTARRGHPQQLLALPDRVNHGRRSCQPADEAGNCSVARCSKPSGNEHHGDEADAFFLAYAWLRGGSRANVFVCALWWPIRRGRVAAALNQRPRTKCTRERVRMRGVSFCICLPLPSPCKAGKDQTTQQCGLCSRLQNEPRNGEHTKDSDRDRRFARHWFRRRKGAS
jgi:hypothetical protein